MVPNSRIVPPTTLDKDHHTRHAASPYITDSALKDPKSTRYLPRTVPFKQGTVYLNAANDPNLQANTKQQQIKRKPLGEPITHASLNNKSYQQPSYNQYHYQRGTPQRLDLSLQSPPLSPPLSSTSSTIRTSYDRSLDSSIFRGRERSFSIDALTADDAKKSNARKGLGKFFKKLGKAIDEDDDNAAQVRSAGHVVSVKSSRAYHNIPLAPPPTLPAPTPKQPDDLIASLPQEYQSRLINKTLTSIRHDEKHQAAVDRSLQHQSSPHTSSSGQSATQAPVFNQSTLSSSRHPASHQPKSTHTLSTPLYHEPLKDHEPADHTPLYHEPLKDHEPVDQTSAPRWSASTRKSSASFSIYSTFGGGDSFTSQEGLDSTTSNTAATSLSSGLENSSEEDPDLAQIVANNVKRRNQARIIVPNETPDESDDEEVFVDADEYSQQDIERFDTRLSKRLSGGHFGSAGGLLHSIQAARTNKPLPQLDETRQNSGLISDVFDSPLTTSNVWHENPSLLLNGFGESPRSDAKDMAGQLWDEDESVVSKTHVAEWLGTRKPFNSVVLVHYMDYFEFQTMRLDSAFRKLCGKLYFKAEAQQIDRILEVFAKRYWECNHQSVFGSSDVVYAVVYSLLLLNTDLHVAQGTYARMTKQAFVKNTMSTIFEQASVKTSKTWEMNMETLLKDLYNSVKQNQILQPLSERPVDFNTLEKRSSLMGGRRVLEMKRNMGAIIRKSMHEPVLEESNVIYPVKSPSSPLSTQRRKRDSVSSVGSGSSFLRTPSSLISPTADSIGPCIMKQGVVARKHLLENATQKAKHRDWRECFLKVSDGQLKMYAITNGTKISSDMNRHDPLRSNVDESTHNTTQLIQTISLVHSLANVLPPPGYNRQRPYVFAIQQSHGGVTLFQTSSQTQANDWTMTCNYWAARQSKEPLSGGVSNMEYGWGQDCLPDTMIYDWLPPAPPTVTSQLDHTDQYHALQKHLLLLNTDINSHRELKPRILARFPVKHPLHVKVLSNWDARSKYLLHEIIKYQNYCDALEKMDL